MTGVISMTGASGATGDDVFARMRLSAIAEPGDEKLGLALRRWTATELSGGLDDGFGGDAGLGQLQQRWLSRDTAADAEKEVARAERHGVRFIAPGTAQWPTQLDDLGLRAPVLLRVMGSADLRSTAVRSIAIVGSRMATRYGDQTADQLAAELAALGWCVVSGGAFGIDAAAHRGAMAAGGLSLCVSAAGADIPAPAANTPLYMRLYDQGAVVSETPLGASPTKSRFLVRNRIIAALSRCVVVVEAALRSGARTTAREAAAMNRIVAAIPGPVTSSASAGCHVMIRDQQAVLVTTAAEVVELVMPRASEAPSSATHAAGEAQQLLLDVMVPDAALAADAIAQQSGVQLRDAVGQLMGLEEQGLVIRTRDGWVRT